MRTGEACLDVLLIATAVGGSAALLYDANNDKISGIALLASALGAFKLYMNNQAKIKILHKGALAFSCVARELNDLVILYENLKQAEEKFKEVTKDAKEEISKLKEKIESEINPNTDNDVQAEIQSFSEVVEQAEREKDNFRFVSELSASRKALDAIRDIETEVSVMLEEEYVGPRPAIEFIENGELPNVAAIQTTNLTSEKLQVALTQLTTGIRTIEEAIVKAEKEVLACKDSILKGRSKQEED